VAECRTEYVATLDQDDLMSPIRLAVQGHVLDCHPEVPAVIGLLTKIDSAGVRCSDDFEARSRERILGIPHCQGAGCVLLNRADFYNHVLFQGTLTISSSTTFRKSVWEKIGGFASRLKVAWDLNFSCKLPTIGTTAFVDQVIGCYRLHDKNTSLQGLTGDCEVLAIRAEHLRNPVFPIDRDAMRRILAQGCYNLAYNESLRGNVLNMTKMNSLSIRYGASPWRVSADIAKGLARSARAILGGGFGALC